MWKEDPTTPQTPLEHGGADLDEEDKEAANVDNLPRDCGMMLDMESGVAFTDTTNVKA